jgi:hypothetical protein
MHCIQEKEFQLFVFSIILWRVCRYKPNEQKEKDAKTYLALPNTLIKDNGSNSLGGISQVYEVHSPTHIFFTPSIYAESKLLLNVYL